MAFHAFEQDATILGSLAPEHRVQTAARNLDPIFPEANRCNYAKLAPRKSIMQAPDWENRAFFAGEQASWTHGWIQVALEA